MTVLPAGGPSTRRSSARVLPFDRQSAVSRRPKVLVFRNNLLPPSETFILAQARALRAVAPVFAAVHPAPASIVPAADAHIVSASASKWGELGRRWYWATGVAPQFHRRLRALRPTLVHAHFAPDGAAALPLQAALGVPLIVTLHGYDVTRDERTHAQKPEGRLYLAHRHELWKRAAVFLCVSHFIKDEALRRGFPADKLVVLPIGIDVEAFRPAACAREKERILFVGRLVEKKGCADLLRAVEHLVAAGVPVNVTFVGDGPLRPVLEQQARKDGLPCEFLGMLPPAAVRDHLRRARVFCVPSKTASDGDSEGLGMVFAEAQAMGTPVVSYRHGGIPEIVAHGTSGLLAEEGDVLGLAEALSLFLRDDALCRDHGLAGTRRMQTIFSLHQQTRKLEELYASVCENHSHASQSRERWN